MKASGREIVLKSVENLRTLGGMKTRDGKVIRKGILLRSAALDHMSAKDAKTLKETYGLKMVIDLRTADEVMKGPDLNMEGLDYKYIPVCPEQIPGVSREVEPGGDMKKGSADMLPDMRDAYRGIMLTEEYVENLATIVKTIIHNRDGAVLWHCTAGKDRCGMTAVFLESILGVSDEDIMTDYLLTNRATKSTAYKYYWLIRIFKRDKAFAEKVRDAYLAGADYLEAALEVVEKTYGGMKAFLKNQMHLSEEEMEEFRQYALEEEAAV